LGSVNPAWLEGSPAQALSSILAEAGLTFALIGGQAVNVWVLPRVTDDFDFVVLAVREGIVSAEETLAQQGFEHTRRQDGGGPSGPDFVQMERRQEPRIIVDIQTAKTRYQEGIITRAIPAGSTDVPVATPEDLVVLKLIANRSVDHKDLVNLMTLPSLDWPYIRKFADEWQVTDRLQELQELIARTNPDR
jgi:hypothetical protein